MKSIDGYKGNLLYANLSENDTTIKTIDNQTKRKFLGGSGLGAKIVMEEMDFLADRFDPGNVLTFTTGPLVGLPFSYSGRYVVCGRSPATGGWGEAHASGFWGPELRFAGFDGMVVKGRAKNPVYLFVHDGEVELRDAGHIWGNDTHETEKLIRQELSDDSVRVLSIGGAGERLSKMAAIISDGGRSASRGGLGAVMGSKNLKAIAVKGTSKKIEIHDKNEFNKLRKEFSKIITESATVDLFKKHGTAGSLETHVAFGNAPTKNWHKGSDPKSLDTISGQVMTKKYLLDRYTCRGCQVKCGRIVAVENSPFKTPKCMGPEYETVASFGNNCLNDDLASVIHANYLVNGYGMDSISAGSVIAFAMECYEKGLINKKDTDGIDLTWGNPSAIIQMIHKIGKREGIGDILADGVKVAAEKIGGGSDKFAVHVKGLELPMHDPRAFASWALAFATSNRGACHTTAITYGVERGVTWPEIGISESLDRFVSDESKSRVAKIMQDFYAVMESLVICKFVVYGGLRLPQLCQLLNAVTGWEVTVDELMKTGERLYNLNRLINVRYGISRKDDTIPWRVAKEMHTEGGAKGHLPDLEKMLDPYYKLRGWDENGIPTLEKLRELSLDEYMQ